MKYILVLLLGLLLFQVDDGLDLPIPPPVYQPAAQGPTQTPPPLPAPTYPDPVEEPRDVPLSTFYGEEIVSGSQTVTFVIDISGSMLEPSEPWVTEDGVSGGSKIERAKYELSRCIKSLPESFKFNIFWYRCEFDRWQESLVPANDENKAAACNWVANLVCIVNMGTNTSGVMDWAIRSYPNTPDKLIVLLTDGNPNCGTEYRRFPLANPEDPNLQRQHIKEVNFSFAPPARINVFGIAASGSFADFCRGVAEDASGSVIFVP